MASRRTRIHPCRGRALGAWCLVIAALAPLPGTAGTGDQPSAEAETVTRNGDVAHQREANRWTGVSRVVAFGDVHGAYDHLVTGLRAAAIIDDELQWTGGDAHLVSLGDLLDRGPDSRQVMDLLMGLQAQSEAAGGRVHVVMGNHELMNLTGDLRYVSAEEYAAFAGEEPEQLREDQFAAFLAQQQHRSPEQPVDEVTARSDFDEQFPIGYFAYRQSFAVDGRYGAWLLDRPLMVVINRDVFVHGGLPPMTASMSMADLNATFSHNLDQVMALGERLIAARWIRADRDLLLQDRVVSSRLETSTDGDPELLDAARRFHDLTREEIFGSRSPHWYRGTAGCNAALESTVLEAALLNLDADRVVVGHTPTSTRRVQQRMEGRAILADTGMFTAVYGGQPAPIIFKPGGLEILYPLHDEIVSEPEYRHPLQMYGLGPQQLEQVLQSAEIFAPVEAYAKDQSFAVTLKSGDGEIEAWFEPGSRKAVGAELAAYRLSRALGINLVPVTVSRPIKDREGTLKAMPLRHITEAERTAQNLRRANWCGVGNDYQLMYAFDALILNEARSMQNMTYNRDNWQLLLSGHGQSFGRGTGLPGYLQSVQKILPGTMPDTLSALDEEGLETLLGDLVGRREIRALLKRRDSMLENWTTVP